MEHEIASSTPSTEVAIDAASSVLQRISRMPPAGAPQPEPIWPAVTYDEARKLAEMFVSSANPAILSELKGSSGEFAYDPMLTSQRADGVIYSYHFKMNRLVNGIPFPQDGVSVELDGDGRIVQYNLVWDPKYRFQDPKYAMAMKDALPAFRDRIHLTTVIPQVSADHSPLLIYDERPGTVMAAATGQFMDLYGRTDPVISSSPLAAKPLSAEPQRQAGGLTKDAAIARTRALFHIADSAELRSDAASLPDGDKWVFDFQMGQGGRLTAEVDQATGLFDVVNRYEPAAADAPPAMTRAEAQSRAEQFLLQLVPYESNELYAAEKNPAAWPGETETATDYGFSYRRMAGAERVDLGEVTVRVNKFTGTVVKFGGGQAIQQSGSVPAVVNSGQAKDAILARNRLELVYSAPYEMRCNNTDYAAAQACAQTTDPSVKDVKLIYQWAWHSQLTSEAIDARTGQWINRGTRAAIEAKADNGAVGGGAADKASQQPESVFLLHDRSYIRTERPDPPRIPTVFTLRQVTPFYSGTDETQTPDGFISPQDVQVLRADVGWNGGGKIWIEVRTWLGARWIYEDVGTSVIPHLPAVITLLENTPIYSDRSYTPEPAAVLTPQDVQVVDADADWYIFQGEERFEKAKSWIKIRTSWLGDQWIYLEQYKIGAVHKLDTRAYVHNESLLSLPYTMNANQVGTIANQAVHIAAEFVSILRRSYRIETPQGNGWVIFNSWPYEPLPNK